jgi:hypothetical protein
VAAEKGHTDIVTLLLEEGAFINFPSNVSKKERMEEREGGGGMEIWKGGRKQGKKRGRNKRNKKDREEIRR